jgi:hypothetical protein
MVFSLPFLRRLDKIKVRPSEALFVGFVKLLHADEDAAAGQRFGRPLD